MTEPTDIAALVGADLAIVVNPNNPDGRTHAPADLLALAGRVGLLIVDESFADPVPQLSVAPMADRGVIVLRSFGKFWGLAGLRLGFALGDAEMVDRMRALAGPWPVSGPALRIGALALADREWMAATTDRLAGEGPRIDALLEMAGASLVGGTHLFRLYQGDATALHTQFARHKIWTRIFPANPRWIRLGLPGSESEWHRLSRAASGTP